MAGTVLVVETDREIGAHVRALFETEGDEVVLARDGRDALRAFHAARPELVVLDDAVPGLDGFTVVQRLRDLSDVPILMLTTDADSSTRVRGFRAGADAYLRKPFDDVELVTKSATLRRRARSTEHATLHRDGRLVIDFAAATVTADGQPVALTPTEFGLLTAFVRHPGQVLSPTQLLRFAWEDGSDVGSERVKFSILRLRRKLGWSGPASPIQTVRGFGYRYEPAVEPAPDGTPGERDSRVRVGTVAPYISEAVLVVDRNANVTRTIGPPGGVLGYGDGMGSTLLEHVHPDDRDEAVTTTFRVLSEPIGTTERIDARLLHADGDWRRFEVLVANHLGDDEIDGLVLRARELEPGD